MLTIHRRHSRNCKAAKAFPSTDLDRCACPLMLMGMDGRGVYHNREAIHTRDKYTAHRVVREIEEGKIVRPQAEGEEITVEKALEKYREIGKAQKGWKAETIVSHEAVHQSLLKFCLGRRVKYLREVDATKLSDWVNGWELAASTKTVRINQVKGFFERAWRLGWIPSDPSLILDSPKVGRVGTTAPFDLDSELPRIMESIPKWEEGLRFKRRVGMSAWLRNPRAASALLLVLRWTGMRISDAFMFNPNLLQKRTVDGQEMYCYFAPKQKKTDHPVFVPLRREDVDPILKVKWMSEGFAFWDGKTPVRDWNNSFTVNCLTYLERVSEVANIHPHRFRDTFAVDLLSKNVDIRTVSRLLGHKNVATTLQYYEHYLKEDQDKLIRAVMGNQSGVIQFPARDAG